MTAPPDGQSCSTCDFFTPGKRLCCHSAPGWSGGPAWPNVEPDDWCASYNLWPGEGAAQLSWSQQPPPGGSDGDYHVQYITTTQGQNVYVNEIVFWHNIKGSWNQMTSIQQPWPP
jgi:hypothetical protein